MTPEEALRKRHQLTVDGYRVIDDILPESFLAELLNSPDVYPRQG